ncbi:MAG: CPBP family intramembrane glutamic endopeptidase [Acidobacteriota bacterium]
MTPGSGQEPTRRWASPIVWVLIFFGGLSLAALVAPAVYAALLAVEPDLRLTLSRVFNRAAMVAAVVMLFVFRRVVGWQELKVLFGRGTKVHRFREVAIGWAAALAAIVAGVAWAMATGRLGVTLNEYHFFAVRTATALIGGLIAALIEESFFRGLMLQSLKGSIGRSAAVVTSSAAYAAVHLLISDRTFVWTGFSLGSGFAYLSQAVGRQLEPASVWPLLGLFLGGVVLALVVGKTRSLYLVIGIHAGWAFAFQVVRHATRVIGDIPGTSELARRHFLVGTGWAWAVLVLSGLVAAVWAMRVSDPPAIDGASTSRDPA